LTPESDEGWRIWKRWVDSRLTAAHIAGILYAGRRGSEALTGRKDYKVAAEAQEEMAREKEERIGRFSE